MTTKEESMIITKYDLLYEQRVTKVETTLEKLEKNLDITFKSINENMREMRSEINQSINKLDNRMWALIVLIPSSILVSIIGGILAKIFHWF